MMEIEILQNFLKHCTGSLGVLVATSDGYVVSQLFNRTMTASTLAAITSSAMSLAESMTKETGQGQCKNLIIEAETGYIVSLRIDETRVLMAMADTSTRLGSLLVSAKHCVEQLSQRIN